MAGFNVIQTALTWQDLRVSRRVEADSLPAVEASGISGQSLAIIYPRIDASVLSGLSACFCCFE